MPLDQEQHPYHSTFRQRIVQVAKEATERGESLTNSQAERIALQQLEEERLHPIHP